MSAMTLSRTPLRKYALAFLGLCLGLSAALSATQASAQSYVELSGKNNPNNKIPVTVADFDNSDLGRQVAQIVRDDLTRSGQFEVQASPALVPNAGWDAIAATGGTTVVYGSIQPGVGGFTVAYKLADVASKSQLDEQNISGEQAKMRHVAHKVADATYLKLTGVRGIFATKIAYVSNKSLIISDADGQNRQVAFRSSSSILSPAWSPDGSKIAYVSFEAGKPVVYVQNLRTGGRSVAANFRGNNSAPAWAPNGQQLAVSLSKDAISQVYLINAGGGSSATRLTNSNMIDTEPYFFPNGSGIVFTSDRGGSAQIYRTGLGGGDASRLTFGGSQNVSGKVSPDSTKLVYSSLRGGSYSIAISNMGSGSDQVLTSGPNDLSPSFAPNGMQVLYAANGGLGVVNADGSFQAMIPSSGNVLTPAWGPFTDQ